MIHQAELDGLARLDICVGGDHGGGKLRMSLKLLFRFEAKDTISRLYQSASVSHSKDNSQLLNETVLQPIGESLQAINDGGSYIVQHDKDSNKLIVKYNIMVTILLCFVFPAVLHNFN
jgi:hypothetical protein